MNEIEIKSNIESPQEKNQNILLWIDYKKELNLSYKFIIGCDGSWQTLQDFNKNDKVMWTPKKDGKYILMVQAKHENSIKPFDYVSKVDYIIGKVQEDLIKDVCIEKRVLSIGEKLSIIVQTINQPVMYRFWIREGENWQLVKDYSADNNLSWSVKEPGTHQILIECKRLDSKKNFDDFKKLQYEVIPVMNLQINDFRCLTPDILINNEIIFQVESEHDDNRMVIYKFILIDSKGIAKCIQGYSTKRMVSLVEKNSGDYTLLCLAKDMYSTKEYDDRAIIKFFIKPYDIVKIQNFTTDVSTPQMAGSTVVFKATVNGGKNVLYKFIIDGNYGEDSGYTNNSTYIWNTKYSGNYKITLWVKDSSFEGNYEDSAEMDFFIDENSKDPVKIDDIILDKNRKLIKGESVNIKVLAKGGIDLRYSFIVMQNEKLIEKVEYGICNWVDFTPKDGGKYSLEVLVKDKYSKRPYDSHSFIYLEAFDFIPANIDYVLFPPKELYMVEDKICINIIAQNTKEILLKYVLKINGHTVEELDFVEEKKYTFTPKYKGIYTIEIFGKNKKSKEQFDCKKEIKIIVHDAFPITNTKINCDKTVIVCNEPILFDVTSSGGKEVLYEFYLMEKGEWNQVQKYSRKSSFSFVPFVKGKYKLLVLSKSQYKGCSYEDYDLLPFDVEEERRM